MTTITAAQYQHIAEATIPWPPKTLSPNGNKGSHWAVNATATKRYKSDCAWRLVACGVERVNADALLVEIEFRPPCRRRRDMDNMLSAIKSGLDALSTALGVDDSKWTLTLVRGEPAAGGEVRISINEALAAVGAVKG